MVACSGGSDSGSGAAWVACQHAVKAQLNNPATADFALMDTTMTDAVIDGTLTAENSFGVKQDLQFHCEMSGEQVTSAEVLPAG